MEQGYLAYGKNKGGTREKNRRTNNDGEILVRKFEERNVGRKKSQTSPN